MSKRRRIRVAELTSYRSGASKSVTLPCIFTGKARAAKVDTVLDVMRDWRLSPFELEGPTVAGIRSGLCLAGHAWRRADAEAAALVGEALRVMGAQRPSWEKGQPEYVIAREDCANCRGPLDAEAIARHDRFCCTECRTVMKQYRNQRYWFAAREASRHASYIARKEGAPPRPCDWCGRAFKPAHARTEVCSIECKNAREKARQAERACGNCGQRFQPSNARGMYCSRSCNIAAQATRDKAMRLDRLEPRNCLECGEVFEPRTFRARLCSKACKDRGYHRRKAEAKAASPFICEECPPMKQAA